MLKWEVLITILSCLLRRGIIMNELNNANFSHAIAGFIKKISETQGKFLTEQQIMFELLTHTHIIDFQTLQDSLGRLGLVASSIKKIFNDLLQTTMPVLVLLNQQDLALITKIDHIEKKLEIITPDSEKIKILSFEEFKKQYSGKFLSIKIDHPFESRADDRHLFKLKYSWFWGTLLQFSGFYSHVIIAAFVINLFTLAFPLYAMNTYDRVVPNNALATLWALSIGLLLVFIFDFLLKTLRAHFVDVANKKFDVILSTRLLKKALDIDMVGQPQSSSVRANHLRDFDGVRDFFSSLVLTGTIDLPFAVIFIGLVAYIGGVLFFIPLTAMIIVIIVTIFLSIPLHRYVNKTSVGVSQKTAILNEALASIETIKSQVSYNSILTCWRSYTQDVSSFFFTCRKFNRFFYSDCYHQLSYPWSLLYQYK